jgi:hypothetical protein
MLISVEKHWVVLKSLSNKLKAPNNMLRMFGSVENITTL